jgi:uncharacterized membrane protein
MTSMLAALVFVITFLVAIPIPSTSAYVNMGDSIIYCTGMLLGAPWAALAAGIGSALADWAIGFPVYIPATLIIKGLMGFVCGMIMKRASSGHDGATRELVKATFFSKNSGFIRFVLASILAGAIMVIGYGLYELVFMGGWGYASATIIPNLIQWIGGVAGGIALYFPIKRIGASLK